VPQADSAVQEGGIEANFVVGASRSMKGLERLIRELADSDMPVLLTSEPGGGKRATAEHIHRLSARHEHAFDLLSASQVNSSISEHQAIHSRFFSPGTVYLEEVADLTLPAQEVLLALASGSEEDANPAQCARLICGTERDLPAEVREGRFREDLHYCISSLSLRLPPLRQRKEDILHLLSLFLRRYAAEFHSAIPILSRETERLFLEYSWPGNLRELEDAARMIVIAGNEALAMGGLRSLLVKSERSNGRRVSLKQAAKAASRDAERELILEVLTRTRWNRRRAAEELQISYKALLYKLKQIAYGEITGSSRNFRGEL
jgi:DNA-binding NtrC family response regulator